MTANNPKLDLVNMNAYIKFGEILSIVLKLLLMYNFSHSGPAVVYSLFIVAPIVCGGFLLGPVVEP